MTESDRMRFLVIGAAAVGGRMDNALAEAVYSCASLRSYCRQHFAYGRSAFHLHRARTLVSQVVYVSGYLLERARTG